MLTSTGTALADQFRKTDENFVILTFPVRITVKPGTLSSTWWDERRVHLWARRVLSRLWSELSFSCRWSSCSCLANLLNSELNLRGSETGTPGRRWGACSNFMLLPWKPEDFYRTLQSTGCANTCARFNIKITGHVSAGLWAHHDKPAAAWVSEAHHHDIRGQTGHLTRITRSPDPK